MEQDDIKDKTTEKGRGGFLVSFIKGRWVSANYYKRNLVSIIIIMGVLMLYISFKFNVQMDLSEIVKLQERLNIARTEMVKASSEYGSRTRESEMTEMLDSLHLYLHVAEQPPYYLDETGKGNSDGKE